MSNYKDTLFNKMLKELVDVTIEPFVVFVDECNKNLIMHVEYEKGGGAVLIPGEEAVAYGFAFDSDHWNNFTMVERLFGGLYNFTKDANPLKRSREQFDVFDDAAERIRFVYETGRHISWIEQESRRFKEILDNFRSCLEEPGPGRRL